MLVCVYRLCGGCAWYAPSYLMQLTGDTSDTAQLIAARSDGKTNMLLQRSA